MKTTIITISTLVLLGLGCAGQVETGRMPEGLEPEEIPGAVPAMPEAPTRTADTEAGGVENTFHHPAALGGAAIDVREALERMEDEGPPAFASRVHSCRKIRYRTLGRLLASRGVNLEADGETSAGRMWRDGDQALGAPNYAARIPETTELTVATSSRMFDLFVQAAPEIMDNMPSREECMVGGVPTSMFDPSTDECTENGVSCLIGAPASPAHVTTCNDVVSRATSIAAGQVIAVAVLLAASNTCE